MGELLLSSGYVPPDFFVEVKKGNVPGHRIVHKHGEAEATTDLAPLDPSGNYRTPLAAVALEFVSDDAADNSAGLGAQEVTIFGLDANWDRVVQTLVTNGTTPVPLTTDLTRLFNWRVKGSGTYGDFEGVGSHVGVMTIREAGAGQTWSTIGKTFYPESQSKIGMFTIEAGATGFLLPISVFVESVKEIDVFLFVRIGAHIVTPPYASLQLLGKAIGVKGSTHLRPASPNGPLPGPADLGFMAKTIAGTGSISATFELMIIENKYLPGIFA